MIEKNYSDKNASDRYGVGQFPNGSMKMYTSTTYQPATVALSLAKADGTFDDVLTVDNERVTRANGDLDVKGKIHFGKYDGSSDPYTLEKVRKGHNDSSLRITINDDSSESVEIWGDSCQVGDCQGPGALRHKFVANGDARHEGNLAVKGHLSVNRTNADKYPSGWGNGIHSWDIYANGTIAAGTNGEVNASLTSEGIVGGKTLCLADVCIDRRQLQKLRDFANKQ
jgi:hypothetical protein